MGVLKRGDSKIESPPDRWLSYYIVSMYIAHFLCVFTSTPPKGDTTFRAIWYSGVMPDQATPNAHHHKKVGVSPEEEQRVANAFEAVREVVAREEAPPDVQPPAGGNPAEVRPEEMQPITGAPVIPKGSPEKQEPGLTPVTTSETSPPAPQPVSPQPASVEQPTVPHPQTGGSERGAPVVEVTEGQVEQTFKIPISATVPDAAQKLMDHAGKVTPDPVTGADQANVLRREVIDTIEQYEGVPESGGQRAA